MVTWIGHALVIGASRGLGLAKRLAETGVKVIGTVRDPQHATALVDVGARAVTLDVEDESSMAHALGEVSSLVPSLDLVLYAAGLLHDGLLQPEKKLADVSPDHLARRFAVNATGPLLVAKHALPLLRRSERAVFASVSARVGSVGDNRLGGWYGYRASKAAQHMLMRTLAIELGRKAKGVVVLSLHPGTVDTDLSAPFQRNVPPSKLFSAERAARQLLAIIDDAPPDDHGAFLAWNSQPIPW